MTVRAIALTALLLCTACLLRWSGTVERVPLRAPLAAIPWQLGAWQGTPHADFDAETMKVLQADEYVSRSYTRAAVPLDLYIGYYASQTRGDTIHSPMNCLPAAGWEPIVRDRARLDGGAAGPIDANRYVIQKGLDKRLVVYWYQSHGRTVASEYWSKVYLVLDSLRLHRSDGALVRVIVPVDGDERRADREAVDFIGHLAPELAAHFPG